MIGCRRRSREGATLGALGQSERALGGRSFFSPPSPLLPPLPPLLPLLLPFFPADDPAALASFFVDEEEEDDDDAMPFLDG